MWGGARHQIDALIAEYRAAGRWKEIQSTINELRREHPIRIPKDLTYVEGKLFEDYIHDMRITQRFAVLNRKAMTDVILRGSPHDAFRGVLRSTLPPDQHAALENAMEQARQFGKDVFAFMEMMEKTDDDFPELFAQAAVVVQRIGQMYASNGFEDSCKART